MSVEAMEWARKAPASSTRERRVLVALADKADTRGRMAWPHHEELARKSQCTTAAVRRHLAALTARGLITMRAEATTTRPAVYDLTLIGGVR